MKTCKKSNAQKPVEDFYKHDDFKDGRDTTCKDCRKGAAKRRHGVKMAKPEPWFIFD